MKRLLCFGLIAIFSVLSFWSCSNNETEKSAEKLSTEAIELIKKQQPGQALSQAKQALAIAEQKNGPQHPSVIKPLQTLAIVYQTQKQFGEAEKNYQRAIRVIENTEGQNSIQAAKIMNNLAGLYHSQKQYEQAISAFEKSLSIVKANYSADHSAAQKIEKNIAAVKQAASGDQAEMAALSGNSNPQMPETPNTKVPKKDYVPPKVKDAALKRLSAGGVNISGLQPEEPVFIGSQGVVFPYSAVQKLEGEENLKIVLLFAAKNNPEKQGAYIFQKCRIASYESYQAELRKQNPNALKQALIEVFPDLYF